MTIAHPPLLDRSALLDRFARARARTRMLFDLLDDAAYYERPIALRNPVVFYEGHLPAFAVNTLVKKALGRPGVDAHLESIFARGIDPDTEATAAARGNPAWPSRPVVREYAAAADRLIEEAIATADLERAGDPLLHRAEALWAILEHEEMHQETLAYMWHHVPYARKRTPPGYVTLPAGAPAGAPGGASGEASWEALRGGASGMASGRERDGGPPAAAAVRVPAGTATMGTAPADAPFAWDNEQPAHVVHVEAFTIDARNVTNAEFMEFLDAGGYREPRWWRPDDWAWVSGEGIGHPFFWTREARRWNWRGMFEMVPLPPDWPVYVTWAEARAFARWRGRRLPTEAEFHRAAFGTPDGSGERRHPWGADMPDRVPGNFDFQRWDPEPVGSHPEGASAFGVQELVGNGWEWTSTAFGPFPGFAPMASYPEYSADFFDDDHYVLKGASPVTPRELVRRGFRNWFRPRYPYVYATFRCAGDA